MSLWGKGIKVQAVSCGKMGEDSYGEILICNSAFSIFCLQLLLEGWLSVAWFLRNRGDNRESETGESEAVLEGTSAIPPFSQGRRTWTSTMIPSQNPFKSAVVSGICHLQNL